MNSAFSLNRLDAYSANAVVEFSLQIIEVVEFNEGHARQQWDERSAILWLSGGG
jgi:hypothetical protein